MAETAIIGASRSRLGMSWPILAFLAAYGTTLGTAKTMLGDPDIFWHIVTGRWIIAHHAVPHTDLFSHTMAGAPWVAHEWLGEAILAAFFDAAGWWGIVILTGICAGTAMALFTRAMLRYLEPRHALIAILSAGVMMAPHWLARPHMIALPLLVAWIAALAAARTESRAPPLALAAVMVVWANLHGTFLVGLGFAAFFAAEAIILASGSAERRIAAMRWGSFIIAALLGTLVTPNGIETYLLPLRLLDMTYALSVLVEWRSVNFAQLQPLEIWLLAALVGALTLGIKLPPIRALMLALLIHLALRHGRNGELLGFIAPLLVAGPIAPQLRRAEAGRNRDAFERWIEALARPAGALAVAGTVLAVAVMGLAAATSALRPNDQIAPAAAVAAAIDHGMTGPVFNDYSFGGYLIFAGIPTFIDGRADMYGDAFIKREYEATHDLGGELPSLLDQYHIAWTIFRPSSQAVAVLDRMPGWRRVFTDGVAVVHERQDAARAP
jgi:hypothetical protein